MHKTSSFFIKENVIKLILIVISFILLVIVPGFHSSFNTKIEDVYSLARGQLQPDTNIVLISINANDINNIGPWPIKRSYYALLINSLSKYKVKAIGLEIFLSAKFVTQSIYDNLITKEIEKSNRVILGSVAGKLYSKNDVYYTDSLSYPSPKLIDENIKTGHLNYLSGEGIKIPQVIHEGKITEYSFAFRIASMLKQINLQNVQTVNFISSWKKFKRYSLLEYFQLVHKKSPLLNNLKNKIIIVGITDQQISPTISTPFDNAMPGSALHAFALDNILKHRSLHTDFLTASGLLFAILILLFFLLTAAGKIKSNLISYSLTTGSFIIISFISFSFFYTQLEYSSFLIPLFLLAVTDAAFFLFKKKKQLDEVLDEKDALGKLLASKEEDLIRLQNELIVTGKNSSGQLETKIKTLQADIEKLKKNEDDKVQADTLEPENTENFYGIIYKSKIMFNVVDLIKKTAPENANILILGESGTGKELVANAIHALSRRKNARFVAVNCGALSDTLLESELFGHVKGAFTGAATDKIGRFEAADKGTIFLDEIAETSENFQIKLLRVIQTGDFEKVGSSKSSHTDVRIVAATNKNIEKEVREKRFREDLYYRLNVIKVELPPLRERKEDVEILVQHFLSKEAPGLKFSKAVMEALQNYTWKGNVRELESVIKRAAIFAKSAGRDLIQLSDLPGEIVKDSLLDLDDVVIETLRNKKFSHASITETAKELGNISRTVVSENFRGFSLKVYVESNFVEDETVMIISGSEDEESNERVRAKLQLFLRNIENDVMKLGSREFDEVKQKFTSKYKNLPQKFHFYLDEIIKNKLK